MIKKLEKELKQLTVKRDKLSKFLSKQNKKTLRTYLCMHKYWC